jgi:hypothetical protein
MRLFRRKQYVPNVCSSPRGLLAGLLSLAAHAGPGMAVYLRSYYTEYEVILDCSDQDH